MIKKRNDKELNENNKFLIFYNGTVVSTIELKYHLFSMYIQMKIGQVHAILIYNESENKMFIKKNSKINREKYFIMKKDRR